MVVQGAVRLGFTLLAQALCPCLVAALNEVKECLCNTLGVRPGEHARDQHVQFLPLGQFLSNYKG